MPWNYDVMWAFSSKKQSAYGTALADGDLTLAYPFRGPDILERKPDLATDEDEMGRGHEWPTAQEVERWDCKLKRNFDVTSFMAAWAGAFGLGQVSTNQPDPVGNPTVYEHTGLFSDPDTSGHQNPAATVVEKLSSGIKRKIKDLTVDKFIISGEGRNRLQLELILAGSGQVEDSSLSMPALTTGSFLRMSGTKLEIGISGAEVDVSSRLRQWTLRVDNGLQLQDGYYPNSGLYRGRCLFGRRKASLSLTLDLDAGSTELDYLENNQELKAILTAEGETISGSYKHKLVITIPKLRYRTALIAEEGHKLVYRLDCNLFYDSSLSGPLELKVTNTQSSYLI